MAYSSLAGKPQFSRLALYLSCRESLPLMLHDTLQTRTELAACNPEQDLRDPCVLVMKLSSVDDKNTLGPGTAWPLPPPVMPRRHSRSLLTAHSQVSPRAATVCHLQILLLPASRMAGLPEMKHATDPLKSPGPPAFYHHVIDPP